MLSCGYTCYRHISGDYLKPFGKSQNFNHVVAILQVVCYNACRQLPSRVDYQVQLFTPRTYGQTGTGSLSLSCDVRRLVFENS